MALLKVEYNISGKRYDEEDMIILREKDFI